MPIPKHVCPVCRRASCYHCPACRADMSAAGHEPGCAAAPSAETPWVRAGRPEIRGGVRVEGTGSPPYRPLCPACDGTGLNSRGGNCVPCVMTGRAPE